MESLDIQNPPKHMVNGCLEPLKTEPQEMFVGSFTPILTRYLDV